MSEKLPSSTFVALMGDLVDSEGARSRTVLHDAFNNAVNQENHKSPSICSPLTITLGDEFQGLVKSFVTAFEIANRMRLRLLTEGVECRFVMGLVTLSSPLNTDTAWNMLGSGLADTRDRLNNKKLTSAYRFYLPPNNYDIVLRLMESVGLALTVTERGWSERQRELAWPKIILGRAVKELNQEVHTTSRNIYKILRAANLDHYEEWLLDIYKAAEYLDTEYNL